MTSEKREDPLTPRQRTWSSIAVLVFGLIALVFLVVIDRPHWFHIRPISGAAAAMSYASDAKPD